MKRLFLAGALVVALLVSASSASAAAYKPTGEFAPFTECPLSNASVNACLYSESSAGEFKVGKKAVPLVNPVVLQAGIQYLAGSPFGPLAIFGAEQGNTLSKTPQPVPGGLLGITAPAWWPKFLRDLFNDTINNGFTGVQATVELAAPATSIKLSIGALLAQTGTALELPVKVKLSNPFLGNNCYIGSNSNPMTIKFTSGTTAPPPPNKPITGAVGTLEINESETLITQKGGKLVDNAFAAPGANGCGGLFSFLIDPFVESIVGVPSAAGTNSAFLEGKILLADPAAVKASIK